MPFPLDPTDGEKANVNGVTYTYNSTLTAWTVTSDFLDTFTGNALIANSATIVDELNSATIVTGNILTDGYFYANGAPFSGGGGGGGGTVTVSPTPPTGSVGDMWIDSDDGTLYLYFDDGDGAQWAEMASVYSINQAPVPDYTNIQSNLIPSANVTYDIGNTTHRWNDIWLSNSTIHIGEATISALGANLLLPATVQIGNAVLDASSGNLALPENISATSVTVSGTVSAANVSTDNYTFANGAPFSSYSNSDVTLLLASFGSNSISTTGNIGAGYFVSSRSIGANTELANTNYMASGPITINNGVTVTITSGGVWSIV